MTTSKAHADGFAVSVSDDGRYHGDPRRALAVGIITQAVVDLAYMRRAGLVGNGGVVTPGGRGKKRVGHYNADNGCTTEVRGLIAWLRGEQGPHRGNGLSMAELLDELNLDLDPPRVAAALGLVGDLAPMNPEPDGCRGRLREVHRDWNERRRAS